MKGERTLVEMEEIDRGFNSDLGSGLGSVTDSNEEEEEQEEEGAK